ncbi:MAG: hypothetical protein KF746_05460 [Chitinophagaceae bacterium]|nr:hypothetical protein [Chitinophagaceae bacterium]
MKPLLLIAYLFLFSCHSINDKQNNDMSEMFTENQILHQLDLAFAGTPNEYYPKGRPQDIKYNFFLDLEHGYCVTAGSRIHLYADSTRWAIVFEKSGYQNRATAAEIELNYVGNCIDYPIDKYPERNYITNSSRIILIDPTEFSKIENKEGKDMETFELIGQDVEEIKVRDNSIPFDNDYRNYEKSGIKVRDYENPKKLIGFDDFVRYLNETNPSVISATEEDIRQHIPKDLPKIMTIKEFHFISFYNKSNPPSTQETYKLIAKVLVTHDSTKWEPAQKPNNHWANWESGNL